MSERCPHCHAAKSAGLCDPCRELKRDLIRARTRYERRRNLHTIPDWPPELGPVHVQPETLPLFPEAPKGTTQ